MKNARIATAAVFGASAAAFVRIAVCVRRGGVRDFDARWASRLGIGERGAERLSIDVGPGAVALQGAALALVVPTRPRKRVAIVLAPLLAGAVGHVVKKLVPRERPAKHRFSPEGGESFPSTHTALATALGLALAQAPPHPAMRIACTGAALAAGVAVGVARIRAAAHWPTDGAAGLLLGVAGASAAFLLLTES